MGYPKKGVLAVVAIATLAIGFWGCACKTTAVRGSEVREMAISGEIAKTDQGYIIRGQTPSAIFTVLNGGPKLDAFVQEGRIVRIDARVVSGDNVDIVKVEGKAYP